jgi:ubiquinone/menaquinone biosynthesis C-methylase UbiE
MVGHEPVSQRRQYEKDWDSYARLIDARKEADEWRLPRETRETHWQELFSLRADDKVLDAGCGNGDYTILALREGARVWAFDYSEEMVRCTAARVERSNYRTEILFRASVTDIPAPDEYFDVVMCLAVLDHVPDADIPRALRELVRVLKTGGRAYLNVPNRFGYHWRAGLWLMQRLGRMLLGETRFFTPWGFDRQVRDSGLVPRRSLGLYVLPPFSGIYTTDLRRITILPEWIVTPLDRIYLAIEQRLRRVRFFQAICFHYFVEAIKPTPESKRP